MKSKRKERCPHCDASMMINSYSMNKTLLRALVKLCRTPGAKARDIFTKSEYSVYTKLKHWGFAEKLEDGLWRITDLGKQFLAGKIAADKEIDYFRDRVIERRGKVFVYDIIPTEESKQKYREMMTPFL